jgi:transposase
MVRGPTGLRKEYIRVRNREYFTRRYSAALHAGVVSYSEAAEAAMLTKYQVYYWRRKLLDTRFHPLQQGGKKVYSLTTMDKLFLRVIAERYPLSGLNEFVRALRVTRNCYVSKSTLSRQFNRWGWSYHRTETKQRAKYTKNNMQRYKDHVLAMPDFFLMLGYERI